MSTAGTPCPFCGQSPEGSSCGQIRSYAAAGGLLPMTCPRCAGSKKVKTVEHGWCRCGHCNGTGYVMIDPNTLVKT